MNSGDPIDGVAPVAEEPLGAAMTWLERGIEEVQHARIEGWSLSEHAAVLRRLVVLRSQLEAGYLHVVALLDGRPDRPVGSPDAAGHLTHGSAIDPGQARRDVRAARLIDAQACGLDPAEGMPALGQALAAGTVLREHIDAAARCLEQIPKHLLDGVDDQGRTGRARVDEFLREQACELPPRMLVRVGKQLLAALAPTKEDRYDPQAHERRLLAMRRDDTGMLIGRFALDPAGAAVFSAAVEAMVKAGLPSAPEPHPDPLDLAGRLPDERTPGQRRADALTDLARMALGETPNGPAATAVSVHLVATVGQLAAARAALPPVQDCDGDPIVPPQSRAESRSMAQATPSDAASSAPDAPGWGYDTGDGSAVAPGSFGRVLCGAVLDATILGANGAVLSQGRSRRLATAAQRKALIARDGGCIVPGCTAPPSWCEAHHVLWWRHGGETNIDNLALLCARHHTGVHSGVWVLRMIDALPWVIPPPTVDPRQLPRRNSIRAAELSALRLGQRLRTSSQEQLPQQTGPPETLEQARPPTALSG